MKMFDSCPGCGADGGEGVFGNVVTNVYYCYDCKTYFCYKCSKGIDSYGHSNCRNHVPYTNTHETKFVGQYKEKMIRY